MRIQNILSQEEVINVFGKEKVTELNKKDCFFAGTIMNNGEVEFSSSVQIEHEQEVKVLTAYYYQDKSNINDETELDSLDWEIYGYTIS